MLDTSVFSHLMRENPHTIARISSFSANDSVSICSVVRGEILFSIGRLANGQRREALAQRANAIFDSMHCHAVPPHAADAYARLKQSQEVVGRKLDENDLWIAATAIALDATLVSADSDFLRITGLSVVNWAS